MDLNKKRTKTVDRVNSVDLAEVSPESISVYPFPEEVLEPVLSPIKSHKDCNFVSLVCKDWYNAERWSRRHVFIGNYYSVPPKIVARRIPQIRSVTLKGKPRFSDFNLVPEDWGADVHPCLSVLAKAYPFLEELRLKRMAVCYSLQVVNSSIFALSNTLITSNTFTSRNSNYFDTQEMLHMDSKHEAASAYADAAHSYKKTSTKACIANLEQALNIFMEIGRLSMAARYCKEIAELYEQEQNLEQAIAYYNKASDLFQGEEVTTSANQCKQKIAQFSAQLEHYFSSSVFQYRSNQLQLFGNVPATHHVDPVNYSGREHNSLAFWPNKRSREVETNLMQKKLPISLNQKLYNEEYDHPSSIPNPHTLSTGLKLSYDDEERNSLITSASGSMTGAAPLMSSFGDSFTIELDRQNEELERYVMLQKEVSQLHSVINGGTGTGNHENDAWAVGSPGGFRWEGFQGSFSPVTAVKRMSRKKEYEVALVGAFRREKDKDLTLQAVTAESEAAMKLAKQREDEIQGLKLRLRFREAAVKRREGVDKVREVEGNPDFSNKDVG
uniref:F-box domain-containing protein n=1 Tax=Lactuca sativa TaxID=4236 RepID=A0A9R1WUP4_LACSA|nr:hypothetical protein LSAT_V11C900461420 [Lactuca sativa]